MFQSTNLNRPKHSYCLILSFSAFLLVFLFLGAAHADDSKIQYKLTDTGILNHSNLGKGIEMRIKPSSLPEGGLGGEILQKVMEKLCKFYAPKVIPFIAEKTGFSDAQFIAVRVISGNSAGGAYVLQAFAIERGTCGEKLN